MLKKTTALKFHIFVSLCLYALLFCFLLVFAVLSFWFSSKKQAFSTLMRESEPKIQTGEIPENLKPGNIGEITTEELKKEGLKEEESLPGLPPVISNAVGTIKEIQTDRLLIAGDGLNFADRQPRDLTVVFNKNTITFGPGQKIKYTGPEGLRHLKVGQTINVSAAENIRGKIQFIAAYINKL